MDTLGTPEPTPHPLVKARDWLARTAFVVSLVVLLAAAYAGLQRRAVLAELQQLDEAVAFWTESQRRATELHKHETFEPPVPWPSPHLQARAVELAATLCFDDAGEQRLLDELTSHFEAQARRAQVAASAAGMPEPALRGMPRSASAPEILRIRLGAPDPMQRRPAIWCAPGFGTLSAPYAQLAAEGLAELAGEGEWGMPPDVEALQARLAAAMDPPASPLLRVLGERFTPERLAALLSVWQGWDAERRWLLDELGQEPALEPDRDRRGYRPGSVALDPYTGQPLPDIEPPALTAVLAPVEAAARGLPARYVVEAGKERVRAARTRAEFIERAGDELKLLHERRTPVERRGEPGAIAASWGGFQLPLSLFVTIAVLPALGLYLLFALYAAKLRATPEATRAALAPDFWFPRLGSPRDPLGRPWPGSVQAALPRLFWLLFHAAPLALAFSATALDLNPLSALELSRLGQRVDALRLLFAVLLVLGFHTALQATSGMDDDVAGRPAPPVLLHQLRRRGWALVGLVLLVALPAGVVFGLQALTGFENHAWIFDGALLAALSAVVFGHRGRPSNFAWLAYALLVAAICLPYLGFALQVLRWLGSHGG